MNLDGMEYYYFRNAQGDIVGLFDRTGEVVVEYNYDAWGNILSTTGSLASTVGMKNPYRYGGYRYDNETGWYYLQSRYYNPIWGRFLSPDQLLDHGSILEQNAFVYCGNNPVTSYDPSGYLSLTRVHNLVRDHIVYRYAASGMLPGGTIYYTSAFSRTKGNYGLCDLINPRTKEVWEIKNAGLSFADASRQLGRYVTGYYAANIGLKMMRGGPILPGSFPYVEGSWVYNVSYYYATQGIIYYSCTPN